MSLRSPFGYIGYEVTMAEELIAILDKFCAYCHTNGDYRSGCRGCPAGNLAFKCKAYIMASEEEDKHYEYYASEEWERKRAEVGAPVPTEGEKQEWLRTAGDYKPECDVLRAMKKRMRRILPHPFFYTKRNREGKYSRPVVLENFVRLVEEFDRLVKERLKKWGLSG